MPTELPHALYLPAAAALPTTLPRPLPRPLPRLFPVAVLVALSAALVAPLPAQAQRLDVCALVACSASGVRSAALTEQARARPATRPSATPSSPVLASTAPDRATPAAPAAPARDPWARRVQGRDTEDGDACLLNFGLDTQLARKGTLETHVLGRTQAWRGPGR